MLTGTEWKPHVNKFGIWPLFTATLMTTFIAMCIAIPLGISVAVYLSEYAKPRTRNILKPILEVLAGIPTIVYGFFALTFMTPFLRAIFGADVVNIYNTASAGLVMGVLISPEQAEKRFGSEHETHSQEHHVNHGDVNGAGCGIGSFLGPAATDGLPHQGGISDLKANHGEKGEGLDGKNDVGGGQLRRHQPRG